ncbi:bifunctional 5,10-methylenetetrahydrofolate dehydrogenase/5,10-methenyltetrahydrofolate cyclohydrolase [Candidatus Kuenenbacteria bacterium]|nr:bifunctional 5,10-methylenetetrahydrofolate dehydrogenase/5,10-methenyltetrahydrofolate cyclohydrolase [Candidatus Kuenenbacteria bacterium]
MVKIINGQKIADQLTARLKNQISKLPRNKKPSLAVILIGQNPASHLYVSLKEKRAKSVGIKFQKYLFPTSVSQAKILSLIQKLNQNKTICAILVQLPLPSKFNTPKIITAIDPRKDADGIHPDNLHLLADKKSPAVLPATAGAVAAILDSLKINLKNKSAAVIGKSQIAGLPIYYYLKNKCREINIYDRSTKNLATRTKKADLLIVAIGQPKFITAKYIHPGSVVIDIGINKLQGKTVGDVDFEKVKNLCSAITPVPGGVGPITVAILLQNTLKLSLHD